MQKKTGKKKSHYPTAQSAVFCLKSETSQQNKNKMFFPQHIVGF